MYFTQTEYAFQMVKTAICCGWKDADGQKFAKMNDAKLSRILLRDPSNSTELLLLLTADDAWTYLNTVHAC